MGTSVCERTETNKLRNKENPKVICHECIGNDVMKNYIKQNGSVGVCTYCGKKRKTVALDALLPTIECGITFSFSRAVDELPCEKGEYVGRTYTTEEVIKEHLFEEIDAQYDDILDDLTDLIDDEVWCDANPFDGAEEDVAFYDWQKFCQVVKEKVRYVFFRADEENKYYDNPALVLDRIAKYVEKLNLTRQIDKNTKLFRCRTHESEKWFAEAADFAPPPAPKSTAGRMNAAGINVFYLTLDQKTALCETDVLGRDFASIASFRVKDSIKVIDLTKIKTLKIPSIFDIENRDKRAAIKFLQKFAETISRKANVKDIDYVPTQIITEFFRYVKNSKKQSYSGILYDSTQNPGGKCLALFLTREEVIDKKYGVHIIPQQTEYYKKEFIRKNDDATTIAIGKLFVDSVSDKKISELPKKKK